MMIKKMKKMKKKMMKKKKKKKKMKINISKKMNSQIILKILIINILFKKD